MYKHSLERELSRSKEALSAVMDDDFAAELYCALTNMMWLKLGHGEERTFEILSQEPTWDGSWTASFRSAGGIVADLRNVTLQQNGEGPEDYMDWYCSRYQIDGENYGEGFVSPRIKSFLNNMGWYNFEYKD